MNTAVPVATCPTPPEPPPSDSAPARPRLPSLRRNISWILAGNVVYAACQWGILIAIARLGTPEMMGQFAVGLAVTTPIFVFAHLQLRQLHVTDADAVFQVRHYFVVRTLALALALAITLLATRILDAQPELLAIVLLLSLKKSLECYCDLLHGVQQRRECLHLVSLSLMARGVTTLGGTVLGLWLTGTLAGGLWGGLLGTVLLLVVVDLPAVWGFSAGSVVWGLMEAASSLLTSSEWRVFRTWVLIRQSLALGTTSFLISLSAQLPRLFVAGWMSDRELGFYAALAYLVVVVNLVVQALGHSIIARLAVFFSEGELRQYQRLLVRSLVVAVSVSALILVSCRLFGSQLVAAVYGAEYAAHHSLLVGFSLISACHATSAILGFAATASRSLRYQPLLATGMLACNIGCCYALIPTLGLWGAIVAQTCGYLVMALGYAAVIRHAIALRARAGRVQFAHGSCHGESPRQPSPSPDRSSVAA